MPPLCCATHRLDALEERLATMFRAENCMTASSGHRHVHFLLIGAAFPQSSGGESPSDGEILLDSSVSVVY
jgi:hypothetical protein